MTAAPDMLCVILAGGKGQRMGGNKPLHPHGGSTLLATVAERLNAQVGTLYINARPDMAGELAPLGLPLVFDAPDFADLGPLSGVLTALRLADSRCEDAVVTVPCDMPNLPDTLVERLLEAPPTDVVHFTGVRDYPLCALWRTALLERLEDTLARRSLLGGLAVWRFLEQLQVCKIPVHDEAAFVNINMPVL